MKGRSEDLVPQPELQELLQKAGSLPLLSDRKRATIIPSGTVSKEKRAEERDVVSQAIGNYGRWQLLMTFLLSLFSFPCTFHIYLPTFTVITHFCNDVVSQAIGNYGRWQLLMTFLLSLFSFPCTSVLKRGNTPIRRCNDVVSQAIGNYGRWQLLMTFLLSLFSFPCTFHIYLPTFTARETKFWCRMPGNFTGLPIENWINYSQPNDNYCQVRDIPVGVTVASILNGTAPLLNTFQKCQEWDFDRSEVGDTIISEWNLVCDRAGLTSLAEVVFLVGVGIGGVVGGWISDRFGRKRILMGMIVAQSVLAILSLLVRSYLQYVVVRLIMGLVSVSVVYAAFVLSVELVGGKWVTIAGVCNFFPLPLAYVIVTLISYLLPNWRTLQLSLSLPGCLLMVLWFFLPESPRWLLSMGRTQEAKAILQKAANFNKRELPADLDKLLIIHRAEHPEEEPSVLMLFQGYLLKRTICLFLAWFSMTIAYYGLLLNIGNFQLGNLHVTSIILAVVEIPAIAMSIPILLKAGRRAPIFITMLVCGLACVASELCTMSSEEKWVVILCLMIGKFSIASTNMMLPIFTAELYPTVIRNLGVGVSQIAAGLALICIPYLWRLKAINEHFPMVTIAALSAFGGAIVLMLPDTSSTDEKTPKSKKPSFDNASPCNGTFTVTDDRGH